jgi:sugar phosphate isomerase/epimerase
VTFRIAEALEVDRISAIVTGPPGRSHLDDLIADFAALCDRAAPLGIHCDLEFIPVWALPDCDGLSQPYDGDLLIDCLQQRRLPGDGAFPIADILRQLDAIGALRCVGLEIFSAALDTMPADRIGALCADAFARFGFIDTAASAAGEARP